ncbi:MAG: DNA cytosine methyltransferase [Caldilineaceae bacterium]|nr:DNA cytosine methyltransferase [Caldilineaceae bacterium]MCB0095654.1 DNA cytosine methyltransferase [Caldilineaceae bacterium]MCB0143675.1 DNA cytosine methyltransferase [Caldilineaceae bacterium]
MTNKINSQPHNPLPYYEFFAGGGMARLGLGEKWACIVANDFSEKKAAAYRANFANSKDLLVEDVRKLATSDLPGQATLAWASFPCQDLSLAGGGQGLRGERSGGSYWGFWQLMHGLTIEERSPSIIVLENVVGTITANQGKDFQVLLESLIELGYAVGPLVINAMHFIPQSRPRLFLIAIKRDLDLPTSLYRPGPDNLWHINALRKAYHNLPAHQKNAWIWWNLPKPEPLTSSLLGLIEEYPESVSWHSKEETNRLLDLMTPAHLNKVKQVQASGKKTVGTIYRRVRKDKNGRKAQRAEIRFDQISGCLRTGSGGSSRQFIMLVEGAKIRSRLLSTREAARLMGLPDSYKLPEKYNDAYHLLGDGLVVPVISWLEKQLLYPLALITQDGYSINEIDNFIRQIQPIQPLLEFA